VALVSLGVLFGSGSPAASAASAASAAGAGSATAVTESLADHDRGGDYLALGDSVPFGYNPLLPVGSDPSRYVGYPELLARGLGLRLTNLSCPGQTTSGFGSLTGTDNGCFPFRSAAALHASYPGTQLEAALSFLRSHPRTRLVTIMIGANNLLLCAHTTPDGCTSPAEVAGVLASTGQDLTATLTSIRGVYSGPLVAVNYYATDASDPATVAAIGALNGVIARVTTGFGGVVADSFTPFERRSAGYGGSACSAGLLIRLPAGGCDIHPSPAGARMLAGAVVRALPREREEAAA
jgi:lysophospholipase L1-like esterase